MSAKQEIINALQKLPENATAEDIEYHVYVALMLQRRLSDTDRTKNLSVEEVRRRLKVWSE